MSVRLCVCARAEALRLQRPWLQQTLHRSQFTPQTLQESQSRTAAEETGKFSLIYFVTLLISVCYLDFV